MALELKVNILKLSATALAGLYTSRCVFVNIVEVPAPRNLPAEMEQRRKFSLLASIQAGLGMATVASGVAVYLLDESDNRNIWILGSGLMAYIIPWEMIVIIMLDIYKCVEAHVMREMGMTFIDFDNRNICILGPGLMAYRILYIYSRLEGNVIFANFGIRNIWILGSGLMAYIIPWTRIVMMLGIRRLLEDNVVRDQGMTFLNFGIRNIWILGSGLMAYIIPWTMIVVMPDIRRLRGDNGVRDQDMIFRIFDWVLDTIEVWNKQQHMLRSLVGLSVFGMFLYATNDVSSI